MTPAASPIFVPIMAPTAAPSVFYVSPLCKETIWPSSAPRSHHCKTPKPTPAHNRQSPSLPADIHV